MSKSTDYRNQQAAKDPAKFGIFNDTHELIAITLKSYALFHHAAEDLRHKANYQSSYFPDVSRPVLRKLDKNDDPV